MLLSSVRQGGRSRVEFGQITFGQVCEGCPEGLFESSQTGAKQPLRLLIQAAKGCGLTDDGCLHAAQGGTAMRSALAAVSAHKTQV